MFDVQSKLFGMGKVVSRETVEGVPCLKVKFENGKEMRLCIPASFSGNAVKALGALEEEVNLAIQAERDRLAAVHAPVTTTPCRTGSRRQRATPYGPVPSAYEDYLIQKGYSTETDSGNRSTVYSYVNAVESVRLEEGLSWDALKKAINVTVPKYDVGGAMEAVGAKSNKTTINALKRFAEFVGNP